MRYSICLLLTLVVLAVIGSTSAYYTDGHNGRPHCKTADEMQQANWRNNNDPTRYWVCKVQGEPGDSGYCDDGQLFQAELNVCVPLHLWRWVPPVDPPTLA